MAFETGTASSMNDLMTKLSTFCTANGFTQDQYTAESGSTDGKLSLHRDSLYVHFAWNSSQSPMIGVYQSLGFISAGTNLWQHTDDSGNGPPSAPSTGATWNGSFQGERFVAKIGSGPYTSYHFFEDDTKKYVHVVLEFTPFTYRHFGFGHLEKFGTWTGGEYVYGHFHDTNNDPSQMEILLASEGDDNTGRGNRAATIHVESLPGQPGASKWGSFERIGSLGSPYVDRAGNNQMRMFGGAPGGPVGSVFNNLPSNSGDGFLPLVQNYIFYRDISATPDNVYLLGTQPDVRTLNITNFDPKAEVTIGSDTWVIFPAVRKQNLDASEESENLGIAYKKVTA